MRVLAVSAIASSALVWTWVTAMPMAFMDAEYPSWIAKQIMLDRCDLGDVVVLGDSRAAADIMPVRLPFRTANLAVGGGGAIEANAILSRVLACPSAPRMVIVSFDPGHFVRPDLFWERSVRFGLLSGPDILALRRASRQEDDQSVYGSNAATLPTLVRDRLYEMRFPPFYFSSLIHGAVTFRWMRNHRLLEATLAARGQYHFGMDPGSDIVALDGHMAEFMPLPILDFYFNKLLAALDGRGIDIRFLAMPVNEATWNEVRPAVRDRFADYLTSYERRYPHFRVVPDLMPHWPNRLFGDQFCHLNPEGAERFSAELARRLEAQTGWLKDSSPDASPKAPSGSKRGS